MGLPAISLDTALDNSLDALIRYDYDALLGLETATQYWGLSTYIGTKPVILFNDDNQVGEGITNELSMIMVFVPAVNTDNVVYLSEHLRITDPEQTVVDMVRYKRHEFHLFETLVSAIDEEQVNVERLNELARQYGVYDTMYSQLEEALECVGEG